MEPLIPANLDGRSKPQLRSLRVETTLHAGGRTGSATKPRSTSEAHPGKQISRSRCLGICQEAGTPIQA